MSALPVPGPSTRERLISAAIEVFVARGYDSARVQDIARAAGLTTGAIYANYRGKNELLFDAIGARADREIDGLLHDAAAHVLLRDAAAHGARELLGLLGDRLVQPREQPSLLPDAIAAARRDEPLASMLRERFAAREALVADVIDRGKGDGSVDPEVDTRAFARFCTTLALGAVALRSLNLDPPEAEGWHLLITRLLDACGPAKEPT